VRLRPLTEAECYARCYGGFRTDQVSIVLPGTRLDEGERVAVARARELAERAEESSAEAA
jgi:ADP-ribose pyrophosphatase YjhB (NUDIX family)